MTQQRRFACFALALLLALPVAAGAATDGRWLHVKVHEEGGENTRVTVNLPVALLESALPMLEHADEIQGGRLQIDESDLTIEDLRGVLAELESSPDATFAEVETDTETIVFFKQGDYLRVETDASRDGTEIRAQFPIVVLRALLSGPDNQLDLAAAVRALAAHGGGDLVTVRDGETQVRVWIDDRPGAD